MSKALTDKTHYTVNITWDDEADVWIAISDDIPLALEHSSFDTLIERVRLAAPELLELNYNYHGDVFLDFSVSPYERVAIHG